LVVLLNQSHDLIEVHDGIYLWGGGKNYKCCITVNENKVSYINTFIYVSVSLINIFACSILFVQKFFVPLMVTQEHEWKKAAKYIKKANVKYEPPKDCEVPNFTYQEARGNSLIYRRDGQVIATIFSL